MQLSEALKIAVSVMGSVLAIAIYLLPSYLAIKYKHPDRIAIVFINILLGWTLIGYLIALIFSMMRTNKRGIIRKHL